MPITPTNFKNDYDFTIGVVPVLGPVEHNEDLRKEDTVKRELHSHRASRHFRSFWHYNQAEFNEFASLLEQTWPGMQVGPPKHDPLPNKLHMFCHEAVHDDPLGFDRELYWVGFGFQIWCQLLTHIVRSKGDSIIVIDEPETYLHPEVQRSLLDILRVNSQCAIIATHASEIMAEAEPEEIIQIDKAKRFSKRLKDVKAVQFVLDEIGSIQNITLTKLAKNKKLLFREGDADLKIIRAFAKILGATTVATGTAFTTTRSDGFTAWDKVKSFAWGVNQALDGELSVGAFFDRDFFCQEELDDHQSEMEQYVELALFLPRKEIENYLLELPVLENAIRKRVGSDYPEEWLTEKVEEISGSLKLEIQGQYIAKRNAHLRSTGIDESHLTSETIEWFNSQWDDINNRLRILPGKRVLRMVRTKLQDEFGKSITDAMILNEFSSETVPDDMKEIMQKLIEFGEK